jgi:hypothetical protein
VYIYYEHHRDVSGKIVLTELRLSSDRHGRLEIHFWNKMENIVFESVKKLLKWPPLQNYSYDPALKLWSYFGQYGVTGTYGEEVIKKVQLVVEALGQPFKAFEVEDLADQAINDKVDLSGARKRTKRMSAEEFFYNHGVPAAQQAMSLETVQKKLTVLMGTEISKKTYRLAAMRLHPDRNNGDGSKMTELNWLWQQWTQLAKETTNA